MDTLPGHQFSAHWDQIRVPQVWLRRHLASVLLTYVVVEETSSIEAKRRRQRAV